MIHFVYVIRKTSSFCRSVLPQQMYITPLSLLTNRPYRMSSVCSWIIYSSWLCVYTFIQINFYILLKSMELWTFAFSMIEFCPEHFWIIILFVYKLWKWLTLQLWFFTLNLYVDTLQKLCRNRITMLNNFKIYGHNFIITYSYSLIWLRLKWYCTIEYCFLFITIDIIFLWLIFTVVLMLHVVNFYFLFSIIGFLIFTFFMLDNNPIIQWLSINQFLMFVLKVCL